MYSTVQTIEWFSFNWLNNTVFSFVFHCSNNYTFIVQLIEQDIFLFIFHCWNYWTTAVQLIEYHIFLLCISLSKELNVFHSIDWKKHFYFYSYFIVQRIEHLSFIWLNNTFSFLFFRCSNYWMMAIQLIEHCIFLLFVLAGKTSEWLPFIWLAVILSFLFFIVQAIEWLPFNWLNNTICFHLFSLFKPLNDFRLIDWTTQFVFIYFCCSNHWMTVIQLIEDQNLFSFIFVVRTSEWLSFNWLYNKISFHLFLLCKWLKDFRSIDWTTHFIFFLFFFSNN